MSTKARGEILELFRDRYLSIAETIDALESRGGYVSVELLNIERAISDDLRAENAKLRAALAAAPAAGGETLANEIAIAGHIRIENGRLLSPTEKSLVVAALRAPPASPLRGREPSREQVARVIAGKISCKSDCANDPTGCGCSDDAADAVMALYSPAIIASPPEREKPS